MQSFCTKYAEYIQNSQVLRLFTRLRIQAFWAVSFLMLKTTNQMKGDYIMIYGYARVSSKKQLHGNSLEEQTTTLTANGATSITA